MKTVFVVLLFTIGVQCQGPQLEELQSSCGKGSALDNLGQFGRYCGDLFQEWYRSVIDPFYLYHKDGFGFGNRLQYENTTALWDSICRWADSMQVCLRNVLPHCGDGIGTELLNNPAAAQFIGGIREVYDSGDTLTAFYRRTCQGTTVKPEIRTLIGDKDFDKNTTCLNATHHTDLRRCLQPLYEELREAPRSFTAFRGQWGQTINRMAAGSLSCMYSIIVSSPCNDVTKKVMYHVARLQLPSGIRISDLNVTEGTSGDFTSVLRCTVGVYGDPHLRLCWQPRLVTCSAPGQQTYISNDFFSVTARNVAIGRPGSPRATSVRSIKITFKTIQDSTLVGTYSGDNGGLPEVFDNTNSSTINQGDDRVTLLLDRYNRRTFIQHSTGMILTLRQWSGNYFFTLRASESLIQTSFGLLSTGCPTAETIALSRFVGRPQFLRRRRQAVSLEQCGLACNQTTDLPEFRETCLFDCYVTEDITFAVNMTDEAAEDVVEIITRDEELRAEAISTTTLAPSTKKPSSAPPRHMSEILYLVVVLILALLI